MDWLCGLTYESGLKICYTAPSAAFKNRKICPADSYRQNRSFGFLYISAFGAVFIPQVEYVSLDFIPLVEYHYLMEVNTMLKHGILGLLSYGPMTGYELMELFRESLNHFWIAQTSQIYRELGNLEKSGYAVSQRIHQSIRPDRIVYTITADGQAELNRWINEVSIDGERRRPMLMKVFFLGEGSAENARKHFEQLRDSSSAYLDLLRAAENSAADDGSPENRRMYWQMTRDYGKRLMQLNIDWANDCIRRLEEMQ